MVIVGQQGDCEAAKKDIELIIKRWNISKYSKYQEKFSVPGELIGYICGKNGHNVKRILNDEYGVEINLMDEKVYISGVRGLHTSRH